METCLLSILVCLAGSWSWPAEGQDDPIVEPPRITLAEQNNLASLVDLCVQRLRLNIEYPEQELRRINVTLHLGEGVSDDELWTLTNRLLAAHGWTSVQMPGEGVLSIVKMTDALRLSRFEDAGTIEGRAGFTSAVRRIDHISLADSIAAIKPLLSQPGGQVVQLGQTDLLLISDLSARLMDVLALLERIDLRPPQGEPVIERVMLLHVEPTQLVAQVTAAVAARDALEPRPLRGKIAAGLDNQSVIIIAAPEVAPVWRGLVERFDQREPVETRTYSPGQFGLGEVAALIEQSVRQAGRAAGVGGSGDSGGSVGSGGSGGSGGRWHLVQDELTGTILLTATAREHERVKELLTRLASMPPGSRRSMRTYVVRNRNVTDMISILEQLIEQDGFEVIREPAVAAQSDDLDDGTEPDRAREPEAGSLSDHRASPGSGSALRQILLTADEQSNSLIVVGEPRIHAQVEALLKSLDVRQLQVAIEVVIVNLNESEMRDLGVELQKLEISGGTLIGLSSLFGLSDLRIDAASPLIGGRGFSGVVLSPGDFSVVIRALKTVNEGAARSYPRLLVNNNEQATLNAVVQEPFSSINATQTVATTSFAGTLDAGTQVTVTPQIAAGDHLVLEYAISLSAFVGDSSDPSLPPPRQQTSIQSVVTIPDDYTIAVGGLETTNEATAISQIPFLGDIPGVGELFKTRSLSNSRSRFYVFIRTSVLRNNGFEDLKYISDRDRFAADVDDGWPVLEPRVIR